MGFGLALVAAPLLILIDRRYVPGPLLGAALLLTITMAIREWHAMDLRRIKVAILGRLISTPPSAWLVGTLSPAAFDLLFGGVVLAGVGASLLHRRVRPTPAAVFLASVASGFMSTTAAIGGPPLALVYQNASGPELRATLAGLFVAGCIVSLTTLAIFGRFGAGDLGRTAVLAAGIALGLALSRPFVRLLDGRAIRPYVLWLSCISALVVLGRALITLR